MPKPHRNLLLVEGEEDKRVIPQVMESFITWGEKHERESWPAEIKELGGIEHLLKPSRIETFQKEPGREALGVMVDANSDPQKRWEDLRKAVLKAIPHIPEQLPTEGLVITTPDGIRFGVWIMPDCKLQGMLETFVARFVDQTTSLWKHVENHCDEAKRLHNAPYNAKHLDKARIHAWLALQDPPGQQLHSAIMQQILVPKSPLADPFVKWFQKLFQV